MNFINLKIGDILVRQKGIFSTHYLVYSGLRNGEPTVAENQVGYGVRYTTLKAALIGNSIERVEKFKGTELQRSQVIPRINSMLGKSYNLVEFNCEHFAREISSGKAESRQVKTVSTVAIASGLAMLTSKNNGVKALGALTMLAGIIGHGSQS